MGFLFTACKTIKTDIWTHIETIPAAHADIYCPILSRLQRHTAWSLAKKRMARNPFIKKPLTSWKPTVVLFCTVRPGLLSNCVCSNCVSSNCINSNCINCILSRSLLCIVTTRSERDSCNSYEHKYQFLHFLKLLKSVKQSIVTKTMQRYTLFQHPPSFFMIFFTLIL